MAFVTGNHSKQPLILQPLKSSCVALEEILDTSEKKKFGRFLRRKRKSKAHCPLDVSSNLGLLVTNSGIFAHNDSEPPATVERFGQPPEEEYQTAKLFQIEVETSLTLRNKFDADFEDIFEGEDHYSNGNDRQKYQVQLLITCNSKEVTARKVARDEGGLSLSNPVVVAEELGDVGVVSLSDNGKWLALSLGVQVWIINLHWRQDGQGSCFIKDVKHIATLDGHTSSILGLNFIRGNLIVSVGNDRTFKVWDVERFICLHESPSLGQFSLTSSAIYESDDEDAVLALGNCEGKVVLYEIQCSGSQVSTSKIGEANLDSGKLNKYATLNAELLNPIASCNNFEAVTVNCNGNRSRQRPATRYIFLIKDQ